MSRNPGFFGSQNQAEREKQIQALRTYFPNVIEKTKNNTYDVLIGPSHPNTALRIILPAQFPTEAPNLQVLPPFPLPPYIDPTGRILPNAHENLMKWTPMNSLGATVSGVVRLITSSRQTGSPNYQQPINPMPYGTNPSYSQYPQNLVNYRPGNAPTSNNMYPPQNPVSSNSNPNLSMSKPPVVSPSGQPVYSNPISAPYNTSNPVPYQIPSSTTPVAVPPPQLQIPELDGLTMERMQQMINNQQSFDDFFNELECVKALETAYAHRITENQQIAQKNIEKQNKLSEVKAELEKTTAQLQSVKENYIQIQHKYTELTGNNKKAVLLDKLRQATEQVEQESDEIVEQYAKGNISLNEFVDHYFQKRKLFHLRNAKIECLQR